MAAKAYRTYVLILLMIIYAVNFLDRQVVTIIAPYLKADLGVSDAQIGLLFGTAFALFYAVFGLPLAKLADGWNRVRTISIGLFFWSSMTAVSGFTSTFAQLGAARVGVGVGAVLLGVGEGVGVAGGTIIAIPPSASPCPEIHLVVV